ncbi:hypothetical protein O9993_09390 [Vibrio lentus]|nr:hypothetical protein [Vibrio lentus]
MSSCTSGTTSRDPYSAFLSIESHAYRLSLRHNRHSLLHIAILVPYVFSSSLLRSIAKQCSTVMAAIGVRIWRNILGTHIALVGLVISV